jgi:protein-L-isoaspartate(D-aspartate) O-methyltransferase
MASSLVQTRESFARAVAAAANVTYAPIIEAFASVPRERYLFPGPWGLPDPNDGKVIVTPDADPRHIYVARLVSLDPSKNLNNGVPSFWAALFEHLRPRPGERAIHAGAGTGYYSAILAKLVGRSGSVLAIEWEPRLAAHAAQAFSDRANVEVLQGDALSLAHGCTDVIVASAGLDAVPLAWIGLLNDCGRMLIPLTAAAPRLGDRIGGGGMLLVTRQGNAYSAQFVSGTYIYHFMGTRSPEAGERLASAIGGSVPYQAVRSLRITEDPDESAWLIGDGWWLSTREA